MYNSTPTYIERLSIPIPIKKPAQQPALWLLLDLDVYLSFRLLFIFRWDGYF